MFNLLLDLVRNYLPYYSLNDSLVFVFLASLPKGKCCKERLFSSSFIGALAPPPYVTRRNLDLYHRLLFCS